MDRCKHQYETALGRVAALLPVIGLLLCLTGSYAAPPVDTSAATAAIHQKDQDALKLTPDQKQRFTAFMSQSQSERAALYGKLRDLHRELRSVYQAYQLDVKRASSLDQQLNQVQQQLLDLHLSEETKIRKILTPEQFATLEAQIHQHMAQRAQQWSHGNNNGEWGH
jgi:Spy/CpxP family protein refolding chaperone